MSLESKVGRQYLDIVDMIKNSVIVAVRETNTTEQLNVDEASLTRILDVVTSEIETSSNRGLDTLLKITSEDQ